jgi:hypothetical protein
MVTPINSLAGPTMGLPPKSSDSLRLFVHFWWIWRSDTFLEIYGDDTKHISNMVMEIYRNIWRYIEIYGNKWK